MVNFALSKTLVKQDYFFNELEEVNGKGIMQNGF